MPLSINDAGTWRTIVGTYVNDAGTWREIQEVYVNDAGTWRSVFVNDTVDISDVSPSSAVEGTPPATAIYQLRNDATVWMTDGDNTLVEISTWINNVANVGNYEVMVTVNSGTTPSGTIGAWQSLSSARTWTLARGTTGTSICSLNVQIRRSADSTVVDTATISMSASYTP